MKYFRLFLIVLVAFSFGAGCRSSEPLTSDHSLLTPSAERHGIDLVLQAQDTPSAEVSIIDPDTARRFTTQLPPTFTDGNGTYTTNHPGESVHVQLSVQGSEEQDRELFRGQAGLEQFEDGQLGAWNVTAAYESALARWIMRATFTDPFAPDKGYHVIECASTSSTYDSYWDGCRTMIQHAQINFPVLDPGIRAQ